MPKRQSPTQELARARFQRNLAAMRAEMGWSYDAAAQRIGVASSYVRLMEKGKRSIPTPEVLARIAAAYGRTMEDMLAENPGPADLSKMPAVVYTFSMSREDTQLIARDVAEAMQQLDEINRRLLERLRLARERAKKNHGRR